MDDIEFEILTVIAADMVPVKIGLEKLCSRDATSIIAEGAFAFVIGELSQQNSDFSKNSKCSLARRINGRRSVVGLIQYLP